MDFLAYVIPVNPNKPAALNNSQAIITAKENKNCAQYCKMIHSCWYDFAQYNSEVVYLTVKTHPDVRNDYVINQSIVFLMM